MREELRTYYFTYGDHPEYPFCGGWTEVRARNMSEALCLFRKKHPDKLISKEAGYFRFINCEFVYTEEQFLSTSMHSGGNRGFFCHERIEAPEPDESIFERIEALTAKLQAAVLSFAEDIQQECRKERQDLS
jgi:hypothetical protein